MRSYLCWRIPAIICFAVLLIGGIDQKTKNALKVQHILKRIEKHQTRPEKKDIAANVSESELNDYINFLLTHDKNQPVNRLKVHLLDKNNVKGLVRLNANALNLGILFGDVLDFDFKGILHTRKGLARIDFRVLKLNGQSVTPHILDIVIQAAAAYNGTEAGSISDWYKLPVGVKRINVNKGKATLFY